MGIWFVIILLVIFVLLRAVAILLKAELFKSLPKKYAQLLFNGYPWVIAITVLITGMIFIFPDVWVENIVNQVIPKAISFSDKAALDEGAGARGDTFGGTYGPLIGWFAAIVTFAAFWVQYKANEQQRYDLKLERFENQFYELIRFHNDHLKELQLPINRLTRGNAGLYIDENREYYDSRKAFVLMYDELRFIFGVCKRIDNDLKAEKFNGYSFPSDSQILKLAYTFFYAGVGTQADIVSKYIAADTDAELFGRVKARLKVLQPGDIFEGIADIDGNIFTNRDLHANRFLGHQNFLGRYYRHLFMVVRNVVNQENDFLSFKQKRNYLKTLRVQLTDFEQLMLYYNAIADFGGEWVKKGYFTKYMMIHNMPLPLANFGITPEELFANELARDDPKDPIFEWS